MLKIYICQKSLNLSCNVKNKTLPPSLSQKKKTKKSRTIILPTNKRPSEHSIGRYKRWESLVMLWVFQGIIQIIGIFLQPQHDTFVKKTKPLSTVVHAWMNSATVTQFDPELSYCVWSFICSSRDYSSFLPHPKTIPPSEVAMLNWLLVWNECTSACASPIMGWPPFQGLYTSYPVFPV